MGQVWIWISKLIFQLHYTNPEQNYKYVGMTEKVQYFQSCDIPVIKSKTKHEPTQNQDGLIVNNRTKWQNVVTTSHAAIQIWEITSTSLNSLEGKILERLYPFDKLT